MLSGFVDLTHVEQRNYALQLIKELIKILLFTFKNEKCKKIKEISLHVFKDFADEDQELYLI